MAIDFEAEGLLEGVEGEVRVARLALLRRLSDEGLSLEELKRATTEGRLPLLPVERLLEGEPRYSFADLADQAGVEPELLQRLLRALGIAQPDEEARAFTDNDVEAAHRVKEALEAGIPPEGILEITRVASSGMASLSEVIGRSIGEALLRPGDTEAEVAERYVDVARQLTPIVGPFLEHVYRVHQVQQMRQAVVGAAELSAGRLPGARDVAVSFADLVGFTRLGERLPTEEIGGVAARLEELAMEVAQPPVRLVKMIGDAAMFVSPDAGALLDSTVRLVDLVDNEGRRFPELRAGVAFGQALSRSGDWYGRPVNLASRITGFARPSTVVAAEEVREAARDGWAWSYAGKRRFKGVKGDVAVYRVRREDPGARN